MKKPFFELVIMAMLLILTALPVEAEEEEAATVWLPLVANQTTAFPEPPTGEDATGDCYFVIEHSDESEGDYYYIDVKKTHPNE